MPLVRFKIRNQLSLGASPELRRTTDAAVEDEDPKAVLTAVEVAGLVGILRQLGDLAEFSAEVFHGIQEEVTVTASRCQKLTSRVKRIESALSPLEKVVLSQTSHVHFVYTAGCEWHPRIQNNKSHFVQSDLPLFVMETYEQCRDPPPLHLLDRFDVGGPGSCLKKYSDPTFFRNELSNPIKADDIKVQRDQAHHKSKKKRLPQRKICRSRAVSTSDETSGARLSSLTDDKQTTSQSTSTVDMPRTSNMQDLFDVVDQSHLQGKSNAQEESEVQLQSVYEDLSKTRDSINGSGYIEYLINQSPVNNPEGKLSEGFLSRSFQPTDRIGSAVPESCIEGVDDNILYIPSEELPVPSASIVYDEKKETVDSRFKKSHKDEEVSEIHDSKIVPGTPDRLRQNERDFDRTYILFDEVGIVGEKQSQSEVNNIPRIPVIEDVGENKSEQDESEGDEFVDARNTIESESESDLDGLPKPKLEHYFGDISTDCSEDASCDTNDGTTDVPSEQSAQDPGLDVFLDESCSTPILSEDANVSCFLSDPMCGEPLAHDKTFQRPSESLLAEEAIQDETILREKPVAAHPLLAGDCTDEISSEKPVSSCPSLEDVIPAEKILPEEHLVDYSSVSEHEKILPGESVPNNPFLVEALPNEKILSEKPFAKIPSLAKAEPDGVVVAEEPDDATSLLAKAVQDAKVSPEVLDSTDISAAEACPQGQISLEEVVGTYPCLAETVSDERALLEEPVSTYPCLAEAVSDERALPEEHVSTYPCLAEAVSDERVLPEEPVSTCLPEIFLEVCPSETFSLEKISHEESDDDAIHPYFSAVVGAERISHDEPDNAAHPSCAEAVRDEKLSPEILDSTNLSVAEAVPQEQISLKEHVVISPCLREAVPDEMVLLEEPVTTCPSLKKSVPVEKIMPEESLGAYPSLAELPNEKISQEKPYDAKAAHDEISSPDVLVSTIFSVAEAVPHKQISLEKLTGSLAETVADEKILPEETVADDKSFVPIKKVLPEEPLEAYPYLEESPKEKILLEKPDDATNPSCAKAVKEENYSPEVLDSSNFYVPEEVVQEQVSLEEFDGTYPCLAGAVPDERVLPEEPVSTCLSLTEAVPIEEVFPEEPLEVCTLEEFSLEKISPEDSDDAIHPSFSEAFGAERISHEEDDDVRHPSCAKGDQDEEMSPEILDSTKLPVAEVVPQEQISLEERPDINPYLAGDVLDKRIFAEEPFTTSLPLAEVMPIEKVLPEESSVVSPCLAEAELDEKILQEEPDATHLSFSEAVGDDKILPQGPGSTHPSLAESDLHEKNSPEELAGTSQLLELVDEQINPEEPIFTYQSLAEAGGMENVLSEEPLPTYPSFAEAVPDEKISLNERDVTCPPSAEAVFNEKISDSEVPGTTTEALGSTIDAGPLNKIFNGEPVGPPSPEAVFNERISDSEAPGTTTEAPGATTEAPGTTTEVLGSTIDARPLNKIFHGEPVGPPSPEAAFNETISDSEAPGATTEAPGATTEGPGATTEGPGATTEAPGSTTEAAPLNKIFPGEPVATHLSLAEVVPDDNIVAEGPAAAYMPLSEGIPDQKVFLDDAAFLSFAEAVFDLKISPEPPGSTYHPSIETAFHEKISPERAVGPPSLATVLPAKNILVEEGEAYVETYTSSDASLNPKSGFSEPESDRTSSVDNKSKGLDARSPFSDGIVAVSPDTRETLPNGISAESVRFWSNGGLLGLEPSKPPVLAKPISVNEYIQSEISKTNVLTRKQESSSRSFEDTEKGSLSLVVSNSNSQHNNMLSHSNGSHLQSTATSFKVFGLSHRLLMAGFRGNTSTCKFEALPTSSDTEVVAMEDKTVINHQQTPGSSIEEQFDYESLFGSPTSSPPVQHMTISFKDSSPVSKLKLKIPSQPQPNGAKTDMFHTFQLVPETASSPHDHDATNSENDSDIFCQSSSPCVSDNCLSGSELWESDESPENKDSNFEESVSSLELIRYRSIHGETGIETPLSGSFLDLPCFDSVDQDPSPPVISMNHQSTSPRLEQEQVVPKFKPSVSEIIRDWPPKANNEQP